MCVYVEIKQHNDSSSSGGGGGGGVNWFGRWEWNNNKKYNDDDGALDAERVVERARVRAGKRDRSKANQLSRRYSVRRTRRRRHLPPQQEPFYAAADQQYPFPLRP